MIEGGGVAVKGVETGAEEQSSINGAVANFVYGAESRRTSRRARAVSLCTCIGNTRAKLARNNDVRQGRRRPAWRHGEPDGRPSPEGLRMVGKRLSPIGFEGLAQSGEPAAAEAFAEFAFEAVDSLADGVVKPTPLFGEHDEPGSPIGWVGLKFDQAARAQVLDDLVDGLPGDAGLTGDVGGAGARIQDIGKDERSGTRAIGVPEARHAGPESDIEPAEGVEKEATEIGPRVFVTHSSGIPLLACSLTTYSQATLLSRSSLLTSLAGAGGW